MTAMKPFRFGVALSLAADRRDWIEQCRTAEAIGFDTIAVIDHLGKPAPIPALMLAAEHTSRPRIGTYVLDATYYHPTLLARDLNTMNQLTDGRLEVGIAPGRPSATREHLAELGMPYPTGVERADALEHAVKEVRRQLTGSLPPLLIGGRGDRALRLAAKHADIIAITGSASSRYGKVGLPAFAGASVVAERVAFARAALGPRLEQIELNNEIPVVIVTRDRRAALAKLQDFAPDVPQDELGDVLGFLVGTPEQIADKLRHNRERYGFSYVTVLEGGVSGGMRAMAPVIEMLR
ncbi:TIGR03621 family F420-dependent LLM class oxidoreductase [Nonomuraea sp. MG754425]|uniref:TIGR03621 family F420-dependent LLM class oxidoreductase n=1 Tax=Nonomuraea sp. MG754425 TaxID=2570319 RepID=UPI001F00CC25|nr:TIGR03621 family F420-dependent LLM class oxidoreductase [Nonomuraea sp. MG754425]MCF6475403.1 TIGR03621 family F420-dependent LLM class oxidoreductase [Nonomuraea sp. MG754425]